MKSGSLLREFLSEDCDAIIARKLVGEIDECRGLSVTRDHTFNRFNLRLVFDENRVIIEDDLNPGEDGEKQLSLAEFKSALQSMV